MCRRGLDYDVSSQCRMFTQVHFRSFLLDSRRCFCSFLCDNSVCSGASARICVVVVGVVHRNKTAGSKSRHAILCRVLFNMSFIGGCPLPQADFDFMHLVSWHFLHMIKKKMISNCGESRKICAL